ncbi:hypothetical protein BDN72DRAFT_893959 [Pluteus cervinus]|uniref:Uncharacterized protein n=1 Tax=Pluteus cervinus TaxID=181527 RepID=A0ACD3B8K6_9AGAR|nr:hypothetical protein BDN72DRAFT_893959 [Pluteus cervinus]
MTRKHVAHQTYREFIANLSRIYRKLERDSLIHLKPTPASPTFANSLQTDSIQPSHRTPNDCPTASTDQADSALLALWVAPGVLVIAPLMTPSQLPSPHPSPYVSYARFGSCKWTKHLHPTRVNKEIRSEEGRDNGVEREKVIKSIAKSRELSRIIANYSGKPLQAGSDHDETWPTTSTAPYWSSDMCYGDMFFPSFSMVRKASAVASEREPAKSNKDKVYYERNGDVLRAKARVRAAKNRAIKKEKELSSLGSAQGEDTNTSSSPHIEESLLLSPNSLVLSSSYNDPTLFDYPPMLDDDDDSDGEAFPNAGPTDLDLRWSPPAIPDALSLDDRNNSQWIAFDALEKTASAWLERWGGLRNWGTRLDELYIQARSNGKVSEWGRMASEHHDAGAKLLQEVENMSGALPLEMWMIRHLWRRQSAVLKQVIQGMTLIQVRVDLLEMGPFSVYESVE